MEIQVSLKKLLKKGTINNELEYQRALVIDRRMRLLVEKYPELATDRSQLRGLIKDYEDKNWAGQETSDKKIEESDLACQFAGQERVFLEKRKNTIKAKLKDTGITQKELGVILGHSSASYMSELMNGINPFTLNDLIVIHHLLNIELDKLIPSILPLEIQNRVLTTVKKISEQQLKPERAF